MVYLLSSSSNETQLSNSLSYNSYTFIKNFYELAKKKHNKYM